MTPTMFPRTRYRLRRELFLALMLKLAALVALKLVLLPPRLPADAAAQGLSQRLASSSSVLIDHTPAAAGVQVTPKDSK